MNFLQEIIDCHPYKTVLVVESKNHSSTLQKLYIDNKLVLQTQGINDNFYEEDVCKNYLHSFVLKSIAEQKCCKEEDIHVVLDPYTAHSVKITSGSGNNSSSNNTKQQGKYVYNYQHTYNLSPEKNLFQYNKCIRTAILTEYYKFLTKNPYFYLIDASDLDLFEIINKILAILLGSSFETCVAIEENGKAWHCSKNKIIISQLEENEKFLDYQTQFRYVFIGGKVVKCD